MLIGYARVSTDEQSVDLQIDALERAGCDRIFRDNGFSGVLRSRPALDEALAHLRPGDTLITWRLDRLGRSLSQAEFERSLISERTKAGMAAARIRGKRMGRPTKQKVG